MSYFYSKCYCIPDEDLYKLNDELLFAKWLASSIWSIQKLVRIVFGTWRVVLVFSCTCDNNVINRGRGLL